MAVISTIRNKFGWLLIGLMIVSLIAFILMDSGSNGGNNVQANDDLAVVDGDPISNTNFTNKLSANIENYRQQTQQPTLSDADMSAIRNSTYNQMVTEVLFDKMYKKLGITIGDEEFRDMTSGTRIHAGIANSFKNAEGAFDKDAFTNYINSLDLENNPTDEPGTKRKAWKNFEEAIIKERLTKKYNTLVEKSMTIPTFMAKDQYFNDKTQAAINYVKVPYSTIIDSTLNLKDADLVAFMKKHPKKYEKEASVDLKIVSFPLVASANDVLDAEKWMNTKIQEWNTKENDSAFISLYSDQPYDKAYFKKDELNSIYKDSLFAATEGKTFGINNEGNSLVAVKLIDRKAIADSVKVRHLLISLEKVGSQEELGQKFELYDSLYTLIDSLNYNLKDLTAQFSDDKSNATDGGDLKTVKPGQMVKEFNDLIFFDMKEGEVKKVQTQFGLHIVEVYSSKPSSTAIQIATLRKNIVPSNTTQEKIYAEASKFAGNNNTKEKFLANEGKTTITNAPSIVLENDNIPGVTGSGRSILQWAFKAEEGEVSTPFSIENAYYVALLESKSDKGIPKITDANRLFILTDAAKAKKGEMIAKKMEGKDINAIATANKVTVQSTQNVAFNNVVIEGKPEPKVTGVALGLAKGKLSEPIVGEDGVYVISVTNQVIPAEDKEAYKSMRESVRSQYSLGVTTKIEQAVRKAAKIEDNRLNFF